MVGEEISPGIYSVASVKHSGKIRILSRTIVGRIKLFAHKRCGCLASRERPRDALRKH